jgi:hypothetical protein
MSTEIIIRKQKIKIKTSDQHQVLELRKLINDKLQYQLLPVYESLLGKISGDLYIDKLILNLGKCSQTELNEKLPLLMKDELSRLLKDKNQIDHSSVIKEGTESKDGNNSVKETDDKSALIYFFEKGIYPWWYSQKNKSPAEIIAAFSNPALESLLIKIVGKLNTVFDNKSEIIKTRVLQQFKDLSAELLIQSFISLQNDNRVRQNCILLSGYESTDSLTKYFNMSKREYHQVFIHYLFDHLLGKNLFDVKEFLLKLNNFEGKRTGNVIAKNEIEKIKTLPTTLKKTIERILNEKAEESKSKISQEELNKSKKEFHIHDDSPAIKKEAESYLQRKENSKAQVSDLCKEEGIYIANAGLILLHPFLRELFNELNLLNDNAGFKSLDSVYKAIACLNFLHTGKEEFDEHHLAFNKIVCGLQPEDNIPASIELLNREQDECNKLLETIINYWEALKGASAEAVRENFFSRNAKLSFNNENYLLQVERNATDILLDRLPWGLGIVKLPWLNYLIYVEW